ncbi:MAG: glyoxalase [Proteobacteria bacterium]|nr:glyoxalase [Pseudomonadota bacterium]
MKNTLGFQQLKVVALAVNDLVRAERFYRDTLGLAPAFEGERQMGFTLGNVTIMLKPVTDGWYARPSAELNPRLTFAVENALQTETALMARGVTISDPVRVYPPDNFHIGAFLDSEGNKLWFCSAIAK